MSAAGAASPETAWERYVNTALWPQWAPQIRAVDTEPTLRAGMRGRIHPLAGPGVSFVVEAVDHQARTWQWRVRMGPVKLRMWHAVLPRDVHGTITLLCAEGPAVVVLPYAPVARHALHRLVRGA
ncbi:MULTISPECIES: SRPBCC family protein [Streptomyces]